MRSRFMLVPVVLAVAAVVACDQGATQPSTELSRSNSAGGSDSSTSGGGNQGGPNGGSGGTDTSGTQYSGPVRLTVTVVSGERNLQAGGNDTLNVAPMAGAKVEVEGILELSQTAQSGTTNASGVFEVSGLPVGPYQLRITPPPGSGGVVQSGRIVLAAAEVGLRFTVFR